MKLKNLARNRSALENKQDIVLDTSSLSELCRESREFCDWVMAGKHRVVVPVVCVHELLAQDDAGSALLRGRRFLHFREVLGSALIIGQDPKELVQMEARRGRPKRSMRLPDSEVEELIAHLSSSDFIPNHMQYLEMSRTYLGKDFSNGLDINARETILNLLPGAEASDLSKFLREPVHVLLNHSNHFFRALIPERSRQRVRRRPADFPASVLLVAFLWLNALSATFADLGFGEYAHILKPPHETKTRGNWVDGRIACCAGHGGLFVTQDKLQRKRTKWIAEKFGLTINTLTLSELFDRPSS